MPGPNISVEVKLDSQGKRLLEAIEKLNRHCEKIEQTVTVVPPGMSICSVGAKNCPCGTVSGKPVVEPGHHVEQRIEIAEALKSFDAVNWMTPRGVQTRKKAMDALINARDLLRDTPEQQPPMNMARLIPLENYDKACEKIRKVQRRIAVREHAAYCGLSQALKLLEKEKT